MYTYLVYEYKSNGTYETSGSEFSNVEDARKFYNRLINHKDFDSKCDTLVLLLCDNVHNVYEPLARYHTR
jgi:hypothetical protein